MTSTFVKICGITRIEDAVNAAACGADAIGLNFWPESSRYVSMETAAAIARALPATVRKVGVFVNATVDEIMRVEVACGLDLLQLHGDESPEFCARWGTRAIRALRLRNEEDIAQIAEYSSIGMILVDAAVKGKYGGTGTVANWPLARKACACGVPVILAGGLTPDNIAEAIREVQPFGVDVAGGVESAPGIKDAGKMRAFIAGAKA